VASGGRARNILSARGRRYREIVVIAIKEQLGGHKTTDKKVRVNILATPPDRRRRDLDNILKPLLDGMEHGGVYKDDSQIDELRIARQEPSRGGEVLVVVSLMRDY
jgi:crossover junction endodeoxyribonuclease RusA